MCVDTDAQALKYYDADLKLLIGQRQRTDSVAQGPSMGGEPSTKAGTKS